MIKSLNLKKKKQNNKKKTNSYNRYRSPVCLFVYNKNHIIKKVLNSISNCRNFSKHKIIIFSDNYKGDKDKKKVQEVRKNLNNFQKKNSNVVIFFRNKNFGLKKNLTHGINQIITKYKKIIVLEDDLILSKDFFDFIEKNLNIYKDKKNVLSVSGYVPPKINNIKDYKFDNFFSHTPCSWGWATWIDRWKKFRPNYSINNKNILKIKKVFKVSSLENYYSFLDINLKNKDLWAANWTYLSIKNKYLNSYPIISKISNIGFDGTGQGGFSEKYNHKLIDSSKKNINLKKKINLDINYDKNLISYFTLNNNFLRIIKFYVPNFIKKFLKLIHQKLL